MSYARSWLMAVYETVKVLIDVAVIVFQPSDIGDYEVPCDQ